MYKRFKNRKKTIPHKGISIINNTFVGFFFNKNRKNTHKGNIYELWDCV